MSVIKTNVMRILDKEKILYRAAFYESSDGHTDGLAVAKKVNKNPEQVFKTLAAYGHSKAVYIFVIPVTCELDLKKASLLTKEKSIMMLPLTDLQKTTGYVRGGCSPIGMKKHYKTYIHSTALSFEDITFSGGKVGVQVTVAPTVLTTLIGAEFGDLV